MTKHDRAKMERRLDAQFKFYPETQENLREFVAREVDRAVRAERKAQRLSAESENRWKNALTRTCGM